MTRHDIRLCALAIAIIAGFALHHAEPDHVAKCATCTEAPAAL